MYTSVELGIYVPRLSLLRVPIALWGVVSLLVGLGIYLGAILLSILRLALFLGEPVVTWVARLLWWSGVPTTVGLLLIALDLACLLPRKRRQPRLVEGDGWTPSGVSVALTAYNDADSIYDAVHDFRTHPLVKRVVVISNNSTDATIERAAAAGAVVFNEPEPGYGSCCHRCLRELLRHEDTNTLVLCEGDLTFRARDLDKLLSFLPHAEIVNATRIVEQLRAPQTQLTTFVYYGNFFVGKLLEVKHLGRGTFTDVGATYKVLRRGALERLLPLLDRSINLEFNAHFLDVALTHGFLIVECPVTFHPRVGRSKGGNVSNWRALKVGVWMIAGLLFGWRFLR